MENLDTKQVKLKYAEAKITVKKWESAYQKENGKRPSKEALHIAPGEIKDAYKTYWRLTKYLSRYEKHDIHKVKPICNSKLLNYNNSKNDSKSVNSSNNLIYGTNNIDSLILKENNHSTTDNFSNCKINEKLHPTDVITNNSIELKAEEKPYNTSGSVNSNFLKNKTNNHLRVWGEHLNKKKASETVTALEPSLYNKMAENMKNHAIITTRMSLKQNSKKNKLASEEEKSRTSEENTESILPKISKEEDLNNKDNVDGELSVKVAMPFIVKKNCINSESLSVSHLSIGKLSENKNLGNRRLNENWVKRCTEISCEDVTDGKGNNDLDGNFSKINIPVNTSKSSDDNIFYSTSNVNNDSHYNEDEVIINHNTSNSPLDSVTDTLTNSKKEIKLDDDIGQSAGNANKNKVTDSQTSKIPHFNNFVNEKAKNLTTYEAENDIFSHEEKLDEKTNASEKESLVESTAKLKRKNNKEEEWIPNPKRTFNEEGEEDLAPKPKRKRAAVKRAAGNSKPKTNKNTSKKSKIIEPETKIEEPETNLPIYDELQELGSLKCSKAVSKRYYSKEERLKYKIENGKLNDNFVKINLKKKVFVRGKRRMTSEKFKRIEWKKKQVEKRAEGGDERAIKKLTCFRCGDFGHWANKCPGKIGDNLMPIDSYNEGDNSYLTLEEAANLAKGISTSTTEGITRMFKATISQDENNSCKNSDDEILSDWDDEDLLSLDVAEKTHYEAQNESKIPSQHSKEKINPSVQPLYELNSSGNIVRTPKEVFDTLHLFGFSSFRKGQEEVIMRILSGQSTLVVQSTGSGKSLCYQLPAYLYAKHFNCITLCVSPLVSLMEDQVTGLPPILKAVCLHTQQSTTNREKALNALKQGGVHILLVSPEAIVSSRGGGILGTLLKELPPVAFACLDEAHCLSEWSHNFRPSYLQVCEILKERFRVNTFLGLTATARNETAISIAKHLHISLLNKGVIMGTCIPNNLVLSVSRDARREEALIHLLTGDRFASCSSIIIYCTRREECERIATFIRTQMITASKIDVKSNSKKTKGFSLDAEAYHAGLSGFRRQQIQKRFMNGKLRIVVATVAFGMGIDKADVQGIIHFNMPRNLESYVQEIGRAGRDGNTAHCHLFLDSSEGKDIQELKRHIFANSVDRYVVRKLLNKIFEHKNCGKLNKLLDLSGNKDAHVNPVEEVNSDIEIATHGSYVCPGHEVGLPINELIETLDLPEENIQTLLCYMEMHPNCGLKLFHHAYSTCVVSCYRGPQQLCAISKKCPPLAVAIAMERKKGKSYDKINSITFQVIDIASQMGWNSRIVKQELKNLEWDKSGVAFKPSGVKVEFNDLAFHLTCRCDLTEEEQDSVLEDIYDRACKQEKDQLKQLQYTYEVLYKASHSSIILCCDEVDEEKSLILKEKIKDYFSHCNNSGLESFHLEEKLYIRPEIEQRIRGDVRSLLSIHSDQSWTGRAIARIFHGISSPNFPSKVWGRVRKFWRLHLETDFNLLLTIASKEILRCK